MHIFITAMLAARVAALASALSLCASQGPFKQVRFCAAVVVIPMKRAHLRLVYLGSTLCASNPSARVTGVGRRAVLL